MGKLLIEAWVGPANQMTQLNGLYSVHGRSTTTLWYFNVAFENGPFVVIFPINNWDFPYSYVKSPESTKFGLWRTFNFLLIPGDPNTTRHPGVISGQNGPRRGEPVRPANSLASAHAILASRLKVRRC